MAWVHDWSEKTCILLSTWFHQWYNGQQLMWGTLNHSWPSAHYTFPASSSLRILHGNYTFHFFLHLFPPTGGRLVTRHFSTVQLIAIRLTRHSFYLLCVTICSNLATLHPFYRYFRGYFTKHIVNLLPSPLLQICTHLYIYHLPFSIYVTNVGYTVFSPTDLPPF